LGLNTKESRKPDITSRKIPFHLATKNTSSDILPFLRAAEKICGKDPTVCKVSDMLEEIKKEIGKTCKNIAIDERIGCMGKVQVIIISDEEIKIEENRIETDGEK
jgi:hypothetical protein